jgi:hypothetical protein
METVSTHELSSGGVAYAMRSEETSFFECLSCRVGRYALCLGGQCGELLGITTKVAEVCEVENNGRVEKGVPERESNPVRYGEGLTDTTTLSEDHDFSRWDHLADSHVEENAAYDERDTSEYHLEAVKHWQHLKAMREARLVRCLEWLARQNKGSIRLAVVEWRKRYYAGVTAAVGQERYFGWVNGRPVMVRRLPNWDRLWLSKAQFEVLMAAAA